MTFGSRTDDEPMGHIDGIARFVRRSGIGTAGGLVGFSVGTETQGSILAPSPFAADGAASELRTRQPNGPWR